MSCYEPIPFADGHSVLCVVLKMLFLLSCLFPYRWMQYILPRTLRGGCIVLPSVNGIFPRPNYGVRRVRATRRLYVPDGTVTSLQHTWPKSVTHCA